jgi:hypothetical protein
MDFFTFFSLCVQDFSSILQAKILENSLNCRENFALQLNRVRFLICASVYGGTKTQDNGIVPIFQFREQNRHQNDA